MKFEIEGNNFGDSLVGFCSLSGLHGEMLDHPMVIELARELGFLETAKWIENNRRLYAEGIFKGFIKLET